ncbi:MAG: fibronectin/fibrinogen-binding protein [Clostridiales bacterium]|nr:fibronectin/fibrinogen-binding protein [Clostridiales bacterium]
MPQDLITLKKIALSLNEKIAGAKVNKITEPSLSEIDIAIYKQGVSRLIMNLSANFCRVSLSYKEKPNPEVCPNFCMLLRKHLTGAEIEKVEIANDDRIIAVTFINYNDFKDAVRYTLFSEIMGKHSNLFLVKDGLILGSLKSTPQDLDSKRVTLVGAQYKFPDNTGKISIFSPDAKGVFLASNGESLDKYILNNFYDFSPKTAGEIAYRISNSLSVYDGEKAYKIALDFSNLNASPVTINDGKMKDFFFTDYISILGERNKFDSIISAMESVYGSAEENSDIKTKRNNLLTYINSQEKKFTKRIAVLTETIISANTLEKYKLYGELITSQMYLIKKGQEKVALTNYTDNGAETVEVSLDSTLSPQQNAQKYFKIYKKKQNAIKQSEIQLEDARRELEYIKSIRFSIENAITLQDFDEIKQELIYLGLIKTQSSKNKNKKSLPLGFIKYEINGVSVLVGKNNVQNDRLLSISDRNDLWFHVKNYHSCHTILKSSDDINNDIIKTVAEICAFYSEASQGVKVEVDYTLRKFVKKQGGKNLGAVYYTDQKSLLVNPNKHQEFIIK